MEAARPRPQGHTASLLDILLIKARHRVSSDSRGGDKDPSFGYEGVCAYREGRNCQ